MNKKIHLLILFLNILNTYAKIIEIKNFNEIQNYCKPEQNTLVVLDIDNTIVESNSPDSRGGDQWFYSALQHFENQGLNNTEAYHRVIPIYTDLNKTHGVKLVENNTSSIIQELQKFCTVIALTARSKRIISTTINQLKELGVDFSQEKIAQKKINFEKFPYPTFFKGGIIFCSDNNKGKILKEFLKQTNLNPKKIIFVDDKEKCLTRVESALKNKHIKFTGLRYGFLDEKVKEFRFSSEMLSIHQGIQKNI